MMNSDEAVGVAHRSPPPQFIIYGEIYGEHLTHLGTYLGDLASRLHARRWSYIMADKALILIVECKKLRESKTASSWTSLIIRPQFKWYEAQPSGEQRNIFTMKFQALHELDDTQGSVQLVEDVRGRHQTSGKQTDIILIPEPSDDPRDPLRWPRWKKLIPFILVNFFAFMCSFSIGGLSQAFVLLAEEFNQPIPKIAGLLTYCILTLGLGNFFWVPLAQCIGKRPVFIAASFVYFVGCIWTSVSQDYTNLLASRIVTAFAGGSTEALGAAIINDLFFLHERGTMMGWCVILLSSGNSLGPLCAGFMISAVGWRWFYWLCTIICGVLFLAVVFCFPETRFERVLVMPTATTSTSDHEMTKPAIASVDSEHLENNTPTAPVYPTSTYWQMFKPWSGIKHDSVMSILIRPPFMLAYPAVIYGIVGYSISLACVVTVNSLNTFVLQEPPYNFSPAINGLVNIPALIGTLSGALVGGYLTDIYSTRDARHHGGRFRPESRLVMLIFPGLLVPAGMLMFGFGATRKYHWAVLFVANGFINTGVTGVASIGMTYVSDCYFPLAHEALLVINGLKNVVAFGYSYGVTPWIVRAGFEKPFGTLAGLFWIIMLVGVGFYVWGERMRHASAKWRIIYG